MSIEGPKSNLFRKRPMHTVKVECFYCFFQGILKGEVSLYR
jgi:hypothetical protein